MSIRTLPRESAFGASPLTVARTAAPFATLLAYLWATYAVANSSTYHQGLVLVAAAFAIMAVSLDLVAGVAGLYSLGHAGLFAIGAYATTILQSHGWNIFEALPVVILATGIVGIVIGTLSLRVSGLYFAITTLVFTIIVNVLLSNLSFTGGYQGLPSPPFPGFPSGLGGLGNALVWAGGGALLLTVVVVWSLRSSALYPVLLAIRDSQAFAAAAGVNTALTRVLVFSLSAAIAGLAGWLFSFLGFITPGQFNATASINILVMVILGGMNTRLGPIVGAAFISLFPTMVSINPLWQEILFGGIFILVIVFFPEGFVGVLARGGRLLARRLLPGLLPERASRIVGARPGATQPAPQTAVATPPPTEPIDPAAPALEARGVCFSYTGEVNVLDGVDLIVRRGTIHGLIGPNGSGKSTLVNLLSGQLMPMAGTVTINGIRAERHPAHERAALGLMRTFQTAAMVRELTTLDNVTIGLYSRFGGLGRRALAWPMLPSARRDARAMTSTSGGALANLGLGRSWAAVRVGDVPHGVEQLTQLAAACVGSPSILILDEPLAGLSAREVEEVADILRGLRTDGVTVIVVEHQTRFIFDVCDEVTVLAAGSLVATGSAAEVRVNDRVREVYLGQ